MKAVVVEVGKINQPNAGALGEPFVERLAEIFVVQQELDLGQQAIDAIGFYAGVDSGNRGAEKLRKDISFFVPDGSVQGEVAVAQAHQMQDAGNLDA